MSHHLVMSLYPSIQIEKPASNRCIHKSSSRHELAKKLSLFKNVTNCFHMIAISIITA